MPSTSKISSRRRLTGLIPVSAFIALALLIGTSDAWAKGNALTAGPMPAEVTQAAETALTRGEGATTSTPTSAPAPLGETYAAREASSKGLEDFKGGDVVIIGSGALIIVLVVLLVLLI